MSGGEVRRESGGRRVANGGGSPGGPSVLRLPPAANLHLLARSPATAPQRPLTIIRVPQNYVAPTAGDVSSPRVQPVRLKMVRPNGSGQQVQSVTNITLNGGIGAGRIISIPSTSNSPALDLRKVAEEEPVSLSGGESPSPPPTPDFYLNQPVHPNSIKKQYYWTVFGDYVKVNEEDSQALYGSDPRRPIRMVTDEMKKVYLEKKGRWPNHKDNPPHGPSQIQPPPPPEPKVNVSSRLDPPMKDKIREGQAGGKKRKQDLGSVSPSDKTEKARKPSTKRKRNSAVPLPVATDASVTDPQRCRQRHRAGGSHPPCWVQTVNDHILGSLKARSSVQDMSCDKIAALSSEEVVIFLARLQILSIDEIEKFREEAIDGECLLLLEQDDLLHTLSLKLGPALKLFNVLQTLKHLN